MADAFEQMMAQFRDMAAKAADPNCSSVTEELDAMEWQFSELARQLTEIDASTNATVRQYGVEGARRCLGTLVQRAYRAKLIAQGHRVTKVS